MIFAWLAKKRSGQRRRKRPEKLQKTGEKRAIGKKVEKACFWGGHHRWTIL
jgi:hypothetical protein